MKFQSNMNEHRISKLKNFELVQSKAFEFEKALKEDKVIDQRVKYYNALYGEPNPRRGEREAHEFEYLLHHYKGKQYQFGAKKGTIGGSTLVMRGKVRREKKEQRAIDPTGECYSGQIRASTGGHKSGESKLHQSPRR